MHGRPDGQAGRRPADPGGRRQRRKAPGRAASHGVPPQTAPPSAPPGARRSSPPPTPAGDGEDGEGGEQPHGEGDLDDDDMENSLSLAAIEAELKPKVLETFDKIADAYKRLRRLQDQDIQFQLKNDDALARRRSASTRSSRKRSSPR